jgi:predicted subunit of tRNA(5-methylaminomethyl-2-thiouridylate) methyltransferase
LKNNNNSNKLELAVKNKVLYLTYNQPHAKNILNFLKKILTKNGVRVSESAADIILLGGWHRQAVRYLHRAANLTVKRREREMERERERENTSFKP